MIKWRVYKSIRCLKGRYENILIGNEQGKNKYCTWKGRKEKY